MTAPLEKSTETTTMAVSAPTYVLEESISSQKLWKQTAGNVSRNALIDKMDFPRASVEQMISVCGYDWLVLKVFLLFIVKMFRISLFICLTWTAATSTTG